MTEEELQAKIADLSKQVEELEKVRAERDSLSTQFQALQEKHNELIETNMQLIRNIPTRQQEPEKAPADLSQMSQDELYRHLKAEAVASFEKPTKTEV